MEPEPTRTIKTAGLYVWGIDPSTLRLAIAWEPAVGTRATERGVTMRSFTRVTNDPAKRLSLIWRETLEAVNALWPKCPPGFVFIERPSGTITNLEFVQAVGAITAAVHTALWHYMQQTPVEFVQSSSWKLLACGHGGLRKPKKVRGAPAPPFEAYPVAAWARENGYAGSSWDECDAIGIAVAARRTVRFA